MSSVLSYLANKWNVEPSSGSDLGRDCFQFRLNKEEDIQEILRNRPYQFGRWMLIVQRWEPIISPTFPSQIPFWINIKGIPLHYWHETVVRNIGLELGELESYGVTRSSARVRVVMDGLKPLPMEPTLDFDTGEESVISLEYERLGNHCSYCFRLSHLQSHCPEKPVELTNHQLDPNMLHQQRALLSDIAHPLNTAPAHTSPQNQPFQHRVDRYGRPFGDRVSTVGNRPVGPRNKIAPAPHTSRQLTDRELPLSPRNQRPRGHHSPPHPRHQYQRSAEDKRQEDRNAQHLSPRRQRESKSPSHGKEADPPRRDNRSPRRSLGRNLDRTDFQTLQQGSPPILSNRVSHSRSPTYQWRAKSPPADQEATSRQRQTHGEETTTHDHPNPLTRERVMDELQEVTLQYLNVEDPKEREARHRRALQSEMDGTVEATATRILLAAASTVQTTNPPSAPHEGGPPLEPGPNTAAAPPEKRRGRPAGTTRKNIRLSPKTYAGMGSKKRNLAQFQASPGPSNRPATRSARKQRRVPTSGDPPVTMIPPMAKPQMDFHLRKRDLP